MCKQNKNEVKAFMFGLIFEIILLNIVVETFKAADFIVEKGSKEHGIKCQKKI